MNHHASPLPTKPFPHPAAGWRAIVCACAAALLLAGCSLLPDVKDETANWSADRLYQEAHAAMVQGNYIRATKLFDQLEARYPYGRYAQQAILESAYANWRGNETAAAIAGADRFIRTYPNHPNVDYAYYLKGLVTFNEDLGILGKISNQDPSERDPQAMRDSFDSLQELVARFPESKYAPDAVKRMRYLINALASSEVNIAEFYLRRRAYVAAVNRAQYAITNYPQATSLERAFVVLIEAIVRGRGRTRRLVVRPERARRRRGSASAPRAR